MKRTVLLLSITLGLMLNGVKCADDSQLKGPAILTRASEQEQKKDLLETIDALIPLVRANINFSENFINHIGNFKTDISDIADPETAEFMNLFLSRGDYMGVAKPEARVRTLFEQHSCDKIANQYFLGALQDLRWALVDIGVGLNHFRIQQSLSSLLNDIADINRATTNDLVHMIASAVQNVKLDVITETHLIALFNAKLPRREVVQRMDLIIQNAVDHRTNPELLQQHQLAMFYWELEKKLRKFCSTLPVSFDGDKIENDFTLTICEVVAKKTKFMAGILRDLECNKGLTEQERRTKEQRLSRYYKIHTLKESLPSDLTIGKFLDIKLPLRTSLFLKQGQEFLPPHAAAELVEKEKRRLKKLKEKELQQSQKAGRAEKTNKPTKPAKEEKREVQIPVEDQSSNFPLPAKEEITTIIAPDIMDKREGEKEAEKTDESMEPIGDSAKGTALNFKQTNPIETEQWDYWSWHNQQDFAKESRPDEQNSIAEVDKSIPRTEILTKGALRFYEAVFGLGGHNVTRSDFNEFLKQVGGQKLKQTPQGLKVVALDDTSVLCTYAVPDLLDNGKTRLFKVHQPHGNEPFLIKTLRSFLEPQLSSAGYNPRQPKIVPQTSSQTIESSTKGNPPKAKTSHTANSKPKNIKNKKRR